VFKKKLEGREGGEREEKEEGERKNQVWSGYLCFQEK
jgi:hypothetical protein